MESMDFLNVEGLKEKKQHGESMLPIALYTVYHKAAGNILPHHWHNEFEFIYMASGQAVFTIDDEVIPVQAGQCLFINSGQIHSGISQMGETKYFSVVFSIELLSSSFDLCRQYFDEIISKKYKLPLLFKPEIPVHRKIIKELKAIIKELTDKYAAYELSVKSRLFSLFCIILREKLLTPVSASNKNPFRSRKYDTLRNILGYISDNYNKKITLAAISQSVNLTPQYLCRFFKEMTHINIIDYINNYRLERATTLLEASKLSITDISLECGFDNVSYFNRVFKKHLGCTPTEFRVKSL